VGVDVAADFQYLSSWSHDFDLINNEKEYAKVDINNLFLSL